MPQFNMNTIDLQRLYKVKASVQAKSLNGAIRALLGLEYEKEKPFPIMEKTGVLVDAEVHSSFKNTARANNTDMHRLLVDLLDNFEPPQETPQ